MPIRAPIVIEIAKDTWLIDEYGLSSCYAILGKDKGLVIDAGEGIFHLEEILNRLFKGKEYFCVLTHYHKENALGYNKLNYITYLHPLDLANFNPNDNKDIFSISSDFKPTSEPPKTNNEIKPLNMEEIDLGGRIVKIIFTPGHTRGSCSFYDTLENIIFTGGEISKDLTIETSASDALMGLFRIRDCNAKRIYGANSTLGDYRSLPNSLLQDSIGCCRALLHPTRAFYEIDKNTIKYNEVTLKHPGLIWNEAEPHTPYPLGM